MEAQEVVRWQKELDKIKVLKLIVDNALAEAVVAVGINYFQDASINANLEYKLLLFIANVVFSRLLFAIVRKLVTTVS
jgi:hypothetical protein